MAVHYRSSAEAARALVDELTTVAPGPHVAVPADLADPEAVRAMVDQAAAALGGLDVLVNNAALVTDAHPITEMSYEDWQDAWRRTIDANVLGAANVTWCAVRHMIGAGGGRIVNVSSRGAFRGEPGYPAYGASKAALNAFGQSMAGALARHDISVTAIAPGYVDTDRVRDRLTGPAGDRIREESPFGRVATPAEVADAVVFLASDQAAYASGAILDFNGASYLRT